MLPKVRKFIDQVLFELTRLRYVGNAGNALHSTGAVGAQTRRSLGHHFLHPLILRLLVLCAPAVLRPRALQDAPAPTDKNS